MMRGRIVLFVALAYILAGNPAVYAGDTVATVASVFPGLAAGILFYARLGKLPDTVLARCDTTEVTTRELQRIPGDGAGLCSAESMETNAFFICEQRAAEEFLFAEASPRLKHTIRDPASMSRQEIVQRYLLTLTENEDVSEKELQDFYRSNQPVFGTSGYAEVRDYIRKYLRDEKRQAKIVKHIRFFGKRHDVVVSASWAERQAELAKRNPVDSARAAGKPLVAVFGGAGCCGPDKLMPVLDSLREKYADGVTIIYIDARKDPLLTARFGVNAVPTLLLYQAGAREAVVTSGCGSVAEVEQRMKKAGLL